jgi:hypothetical protein
MAVFWDVAPCSLVEVYQRFRGSYSLHGDRSDDRGCKHLWNVGKLLPVNMVQHPIFVLAAVRNWNLQIIRLYLLGLNTSLRTSLTVKFLDWKLLLMNFSSRPTNSLVILVSPYLGYSIRTARSLRCRSTWPQWFSWYTGSPLRNKSLRTYSSETVIKFNVIVQNLWNQTETQTE